MTRLRRDLEESGIMAFDFYDQINKLILKYPKYGKYLHEIDRTTYKTAEKSLFEIAKRAKLNAKNSKNEALKNGHFQAEKEIRDITSQNPVMLEMTRTGQESANMSKREEKRKVKYQRKPRSFSGLEIFALINQLLKTDEWENLTIGVALATGRRCSEIIHFGEFEPTKISSRIKFSGLRKNKTKQNKQFTIPALVDCHMVCDAIERLRSHPRITSLMERLLNSDLHEGEIARQVNGSVAKQLNETMNAFMNDKNKQGQHWVFKDSRALYARIAYTVYEANQTANKREPIQEIEFFKNHLIHTDMNETLSYLQFKLNDKEKISRSQIDIAKNMAGKLEYEDRLELLRDFLKSDAVLHRKVFARMAIMLVSAVDHEPDVTINGAMVFRIAGGRRETALELAKMIKERKLDKPNQILKENKNKKEKQKVIKTVEVEIKLTFVKQIAIEIEEDEDEQNAIDEAVKNAVWNELDVTDYNHIDWVEL
ncbi:protelomerase family protein (plasmid) [Xenorhabdus sp. SF857]|nr:protelomerase family protein [Xenorhabdus sp. SF857]WFQ78077.1 protelomerase family protein [Xenorhabdus sp. SF857]